MKMNNKEEDVLKKIRTAKLMTLQGDDIGAREVYREAGNLLTRLYGEYFFYIALYSLPSNLKHLAKDITQEVFLGAFRNLYRFDEDLGNTLEQWLFGIYKNCRIDALIRNSRQSGRYPTNRINDSEKKTDLKAFSEERLMRTAIFQKRLDKLEDLDRTIIAMNIEGMTSIEIASYTRLSPAAVRKRIERATKILKGEKRTDEAKG